MAHELAKMFNGKYRMKYRYRSDNDRPWHEDETKVERWLTDPTIEEVIKDLQAQVEITLRPIFDINGDLIPEIRETWRGTFDDQNNPVLDENGKYLGTRLGIVGPDYTVLQDQDVVKWFEPWVESKSCTIETAGALFGGKRFWVLAKLTLDPMEVVPGDEIEQYVFAINGHDGILAFRAFPTSVRVICNNTSQIALASSLARRFRAKHSKMVYLKAGEIRDEVAAMQGILSKNVDKFKLLAASNVKSDNELKAYFQTILGEKVNLEVEVKEDGKRPLATLMRLFEEGAGNDLPGVKGTYWSAFNAVTDFISHMRGRNSDSRLDYMFAGAGATMINQALELGLNVASGNVDLLAA